MPESQWKKIIEAVRGKEMARVWAEFKNFVAPVAQLPERRSSKPDVEGGIPSGSASSNG
jgi:hypothetical protein